MNYTTQIVLLKSGTSSLDIWLSFGRGIAKLLMYSSFGLELGIAVRRLPNMVYNVEVWVVVLLMMDR
jgi:hypothetical protein